MWPWRDANSKHVEVFTVAYVDEDCVGNSLLQIWKLRVGELCSDFEHKIWSIFWSWRSGKILKPEFGQYLQLMFCRGCEVESWLNSGVRLSLSYMTVEIQKSIWLLVVPWNLPLTCLNRVATSTGPPQRTIQMWRRPAPSSLTRTAARWGWWGQRWLFTRHWSHIGWGDCNDLRSC